MRPTRGAMVVLLGGDYCGKSSAMRALREQNAWGLVSCDDDFLPDAYRSMTRLRDVFFESVLPHVKQMPSPDFALLGLQMATAYLRDWAGKLRERGPVLVDSYYYKVLAKCSCTAWSSADVLAAWRNYPQPDEVIYLSVDPEIALARARTHGGPNPFEAMGSKASDDRDGFLEFQRRLARSMLEEIRGIPTNVVDANRSPAEVAHDVRQLLQRRHRT
jgi:thymidylate kinase